MFFSTPILFYLRPNPALSCPGPLQRILKSKNVCVGGGGGGGGCWHKASGGGVVLLALIEHDVAINMAAPSVWYAFIGPDGDSFLLAPCHSSSVAMGTGGREEFKKWTALTKWDTLQWVGGWVL